MSKEACTKINETEMFPNTAKAVNSLKDSLLCQSCNSYMKQPVALRNCDHIFCLACVEQASVCPVCRIPLWIQDKVVSKKMQNISNTCLQINDQMKIIADVPEYGSFDPKYCQTESQILLKTPYSKTKKGTKQVGTPKTQSLPYPKLTKSCQKNKKGESDLHLAAISGQYQTLVSLLEDGADVNVKDNAGWSPLHEACIRGYNSIVEKLLDFGAFVDMPGHGNDSPLMDAVANDNYETVELLLKRGANTTLRNAEGKTAESFAKSEPMKILLKSSMKNFDKKQDFSAYKMDKLSEKTIAFSSSIESTIVTLCTECLKCKVLKGTAFGSTHFLTKVNHAGKAIRSLKYLQAIACGAWILNEKWINACITQKNLVDEVSFQVKGCLEDPNVGGPLRSTTSRLRQLPRLFDGCHFYLHGVFSLPNKKEIIELIKAADGQVLSRSPKPDSDCIQVCRKVPYHISPDTQNHSYTYYIVYDSSQKSLPKFIQQGKVSTVPVSWILNCLSQFSFVNIPVDLL